MVSSTRDFPALVVLRAIFDLAAVDMPATPQLLADLLGERLDTIYVQVAQLRKDGLLQGPNPTLTMRGLVIATQLPDTAPVPMSQALPAGLAAA